MGETERKITPDAKSSNRQEDAAQMELLAYKERKIRVRKEKRLNSLLSHKSGRAK